MASAFLLVNCSQEVVVNFILGVLLLVLSHCRTWLELKMGNRREVLYLKVHIVFRCNCRLHAGMHWMLKAAMVQLAQHTVFQNSQVERIHISFATAVCALPRISPASLDLLCLFNVIWGLSSVDQHVLPSCRNESRMLDLVLHEMARVLVLPCPDLKCLSFSCHLTLCGPQIVPALHTCLCFQPVPLWSYESQCA